MRAPRALLVVDRGFALVVVAEVWAAAAAAASVARFCNCRAFMPVEGRETCVSKRPAGPGSKHEGRRREPGPRAAGPATACSARLPRGLGRHHASQRSRLLCARLPVLTQGASRLPVPGAAAISGKDEKSPRVHRPCSCQETVSRGWAAAGRATGGAPR